VMDEYFRKRYPMFESWVSHDHIESLAINLRVRLHLPPFLDLSTVADVSGKMTVNGPGLRDGRWVTTFQGVKRFLINFDEDMKAERRGTPSVMFLLKAGSKPIRCNEKGELVT
jgi:hypothetical protein